MKKIQNFIKQRSKILLVSFILSVVLFILILPEFLTYSDFINHIINYEEFNMEVTEATLGEVIWSTHSVEAHQEFNLMFSCIFVFISLFNLVGYIYKKNEFIFISIGLGILVTCMSISVTNPSFIILITLSTILNVFGYIEQYNLNKE